MRTAFTLIELVVVLAVISLLAGMVLGTGQRDQRDAQVRAAAEQLAAVLGRARNLAMADQAVFGVAFNIQNAPGSSGAVLNNRSGGHWYRIVGPSQESSLGEMQRCIPMSGMTSWYAPLRNFPDFVEAVARSWVGPVHQLPARQVRFLALSDTDEGRKTRRPARTGTGSTGSVNYNSSGETTYPRPWFGYYDAVAKRLWPWGGYVSAKSYSGFYYQGSGGAVTGCVNPATRSFNNNFNWEKGTAADPMAFADVDRNGDGDVDDAGEREVGYQVLTAGEPRPLVDAAWLDACLVFRPSGEVQFQEWNRARRAYRNIQATLADPGWELRNGVSDRAKPPYDDPYSTHATPLYADNCYECPFDIPEVAHFTRHTGGWFITLAPDAQADQVEFATARQAIESITPMYRVFVGANGTIQVIRVRYQEQALAGATMWPPQPGDWLDSAKVWTNCRLGYLHVADGGDTVRYGQFIPRGTPVTDIICAQMIEGRQWWRDE